MGKIIRLTEQDINRIVEKSIKRVLREEVDMGQIPSAQDKKSRRRKTSPREDEIRKQIRKLRQQIDRYEEEGKDIKPIQKQIDKLKKEAGF